MCGSFALLMARLIPQPRSRGPNRASDVQASIRQTPVISDDGSARLRSRMVVTDDENSEMSNAKRYRNRMVDADRSRFRCAGATGFAQVRHCLVLVSHGCEGILISFISVHGSARVRRYF